MFFFWHQEAPAVEFLLNSYPDYVKIEDLPIETQQKQVSYFCNIFH